MDKNANPTNPLAAAPAPPKPAAPPPEPGAAMPNPLALLRRAIEHWQVIGVAMVIGVVVTAQVVRMRKASYKSEAVLFFREAGFKANEGPADPGAARGMANKFKETLLAQANLKKVMDECKAFRDVVEKKGYTDAVDQMRKKVDFKARAADTFAISFEGTTREEAQICAARLADNLVAEDAKNRANAVKGQTEFLMSEKRRVDEEAERLERELAQFMADHPEYAGATPGAKGISIRHLKKEEDAAKKEALRKSKSKGKGALGGGGGGRRRRGGPEQMGGPPGAATSKGPAVDPMLIAARSAALAELTAARKDHAAKSVKFTEAHPDVRAAAARLDAATAAYDEANAAVAAAMPADPAPAPPPAPVASSDDPYAEPAPTAKPKASAVAGAAPAPTDDKEKPKLPPKVRVDGDDADLLALEAEWSRINRELGPARAHQNELEGKLFKAEIVASSEAGGYGAQLVLLDPAFKPGAPANMPNTTVMLIGFAASLGAGLLISAAWGLLFDDRVFHASELENIVEVLPLLGTVPKVKEVKPKRRWARG